MILESVRYYVRCASFCIFRSPEIVSVFKGFRLLRDRLTDKFSRPPRYDRFDIPAYIWCGLLHHIYAVLFRSGSWNSFHESASHTPRRRVKLACKRWVRVSSTEIFLRCSKSSYQLFIFSFCSAYNKTEHQSLIYNITLFFGSQYTFKRFFQKKQKNTWQVK